MAKIKHSGSFHGKSNALGHGGRAAQMKAQGVPGGVIGTIARREGAAPGGPNFHPSKPKASKSPLKTPKPMKPMKMATPPKAPMLGADNRAGRLNTVATDRGNFRFKDNRRGE